MKLVLAIIPPELANNIMDDIDEQHLHVLTISEAQGFIQEGGIGFTDLELMPRTRVEVICEDHEVQGLIDSLHRSMRNDKRARGRILVLPIDRVDAIGNGNGNGERKK